MLPGTTTQRINLLFMLIAMVLALLSYASGRAVYQSALSAMATLSTNKLEFAIAALQSDLRRFKIAGKMLATSDVVKRIIQSGISATADDSQQLVERSAALVGAAKIQIVDAQGRLVFDTDSKAEFEAVSLIADPDIADTQQGRLGLHVSGDAGKAKLNISLPVWIGNDYAGAVKLQVLADQLALDFKPSQELTFFTDLDGVVLISNRLRIAGLKIPDLSVADHSITTQRYGVTAEESVELLDGELSSGSVISPSQRFLELADEQHRQYLVLSLRAPELRMMAWSFGTTASAARLGWLTGMLTFCTLLGISWTVRSLIERRTSALSQLAHEEEINAQLEQRVATRTKELSELNTMLRSEIDERQHAEKTLQATRDNLVQVEKLSALGQLSAGISHELNQPLAAIRSYADNAVTLLEQQQFAQTRTNLEHISDVTDRASRILRNLRAFARNEVEPATLTSLTEAVEHTLIMLDAKLRDCDVHVSLQKPDTPVLVMGGKVRLQQVVTNIITNSIDAMSMQTNKQLELDISLTTQTARLAIRDNGVGLNPESLDTVFDPFNSTKTTHEDQGLGLGLSIARDIVEGFAGRIDASNNPGQGACFSVHLPLQ